MTQTTQDPRLDLWIEQNVFRRARSKRFAVQKYTRYPNKAFDVVNYLGLEWSLGYRMETRFQIEILGRIELASTWDEVPLALCRLVYRTMTGFEWAEDLDAKEDQ